MTGKAPFENRRFAQCYLRVSEKADRRGGLEHRRRLLAGLSGTVCEVGAGQGLNFAHYPASVSRLLAIEPEPTLGDHAIDAASRSPIPIEVVDGTADALAVADESCDAVVASLVLCSVPDQGRSLGEARRVLKPGGELRFYEHVRSTHAAMALLEDAITPMWARFAGGCHLNRDTVAAIGTAGLDVIEVDRFKFSPQRLVPATAHVLGRATRR
jgi:ubiquinone/menaquinone biosynthesis C-methylase UbiE